MWRIFATLCITYLHLLKISSQRGGKVTSKIEHVDVLVVGAGISGICAAYYLQTKSQNKSYTILEGRDAIGGTWDLFRYPGIRSDSDMYTLGFSFNPWTDGKSIAEGHTILQYLHETVDKFDMRQHIRFNHYVTHASWSSETALWTVDVQVGEEKQIFTCNFLYMCSGYYDYDNGYTPEFEGRERFQGDVIHPQHWDDSLDYTDKEVIIIGSGATAVTLAPAMAEKAKRVTMLQRSPTYIVSMPSEDKLAQRLQKIFPLKLAHHLARWNSILYQIYSFNIAQHKPELTKDEILKMAREELPDDFDVDKHLSPSYNPWDQRLCLIPDSDLFHAINAGKVAIVTDHIDTFVEDGICLQSGEKLSADIIVTATGLKVQLGGGMLMKIDGKDVVISDTVSYKGFMLSDIPNFANSVGYSNASWTLKAELIAEYVCRLLNHMDKHNMAQVTPRLGDTQIDDDPLIPLSSGYITRALDELPKQGSRKPWRVYQNYIRDMINTRFSTLDDGAMEFMPRKQKNL